MYNLLKSNSISINTDIFSHHVPDNIMSRFCFLEGILKLQKQSLLTYLDPTNCVSSSIFGHRNLRYSVSLLGSVVIK